ncbi:MAG: hypothetical protein Q9222_004167 [Ikaeria aurantiellina]
MAYNFSVSDVLSIAAVHPFYNSNIKYPPSQAEIRRIQDPRTENHSSTPPLSMWPLLSKNALYATVRRLCADDSPHNEYRRSSYISITGGGSGKGLPMLFLTNQAENRNQRVAMGELMRACKMVEPWDWVLNLHYSGNFYRSLDLSTETLELAGGNVLCGGHLLPHDKSVMACLEYRVNFLASDTASLLNFAHHVETLPLDIRAKLRVKKIMYTSEAMSRPKQAFLRSIFGPVSFFSCLAAAETGPWAVANLSWGEDQAEPDQESRIFVFDSRTMRVEVLSLSINPQLASSLDDSDFAPEGTAGHLILTSLQRLTNPLVRYVSGDVGAVESLPSPISVQFPADMVEHLKILRLHGRDKRFSFKWLGDYYEFENLDKVMQSPEWGVLQWQIILTSDLHMQASDRLEVRLLRRAAGEGLISDDELRMRLHDAFYLTLHTEKLFRAELLSDLSGFERSESSGKVIRFIDRRGKAPDVGTAASPRRCLLVQYSSSFASPLQPPDRTSVHTLEASIKPLTPTGKNQFKIMHIVGSGSSASLKELPLVAPLTLKASRACLNAEAFTLAARTARNPSREHQKRGEMLTSSNCSFCTFSAIANAEHWQTDASSAALESQLQRGFTNARMRFAEAPTRNHTINLTMTVTVTLEEPPWEQPGHPQLIQVHRIAGKYQSYATSMVDLRAGSLFCPIENHFFIKNRTWPSVQAPNGSHIDLNSGSLLPKGRDLHEGDVLTFFYPSTEWHMVQPFECNCGTSGCLGMIKGASEMGKAKLNGYWLNDHIQERLDKQLEKREGTYRRVARDNEASVDHAATQVV